MSKSRIATPPWIGSHGDYTERQCARAVSGAMFPKTFPRPPGIPLGFAKRNLWPASPKSTLFDYFDLWNYDGTLENHHA